MKSPSDLLIRISTQIPNFELCCERLAQLNRRKEIPENADEGHETEHHEALTTLNEIANGPPAHCIFTPMHLPLSEEGMIPRLWRVHQRALTLQRTALGVTLAWTRDLLHLLLPHWLALRADNWILGGASKCSVIFAEVSLEGTGGVETSNSSLLKSGRKRSKNKNQLRRGWLSGQNSPKMDISQALRLVNRPNSPQVSIVYEGSPCNERNLDLLYLSGGVPIVRIEAWLAYHREASPPPNSPESIENGGEITTMCRDLAVVTCVYGSHLTVGLTADCKMDGRPGLDLILNSMLKQLNCLYKLLDSRFPAKPVIYAPRRRIHLTSPSTSRTRVIQSSPRAPSRPQTPEVQEAPPCAEMVIGGELVSTMTCLPISKLVRTL